MSSKLIQALIFREIYLYGLIQKQKQLNCYTIDVYRYQALTAMRASSQTFKIKNV
jgi:hypothetical protein